MEFLSYLVIPIVALVGLGGTILWIWAIIDCATKEPAEGNDRIVWIYPSG